MSVKLTARGIKRLEITMHDVMDGMEDAASYMNYLSVPETVEILSIEPPGRSMPPLQEILQFKKTDTSELNQSSNIVEYLIQRELQKTA
ncbi:MAG: hypothetical protein KAT06_10740 [Gammaproteobacteria bacterium]|nr:hypothetical protein [Gammaproteobacteria bacterium]